MESETQTVDRRFLAVTEGSSQDVPCPPLSVVTYNIIAPKYTTWLTYAPPEVLDSSTRCARILQELLAYQADIICLQEVERPFLDDELQDFRTAHGYEALFQPRPLKPSGQGGERPPSAAGPEEGVALLYRVQRLELVASTCVRLGDAVGPEEKGPLWERTKGLREGAVWAVLHDRLVQRTLLAGCTHLYWQNPEAQIAQAHLLCKAGRELLRAAGLGEGATPVLLAGDFNSLPPRGASCEGIRCAYKSGGGVYTLLSEGALGPSHPKHPAARTAGALLSSDPSEDPAQAPTFTTSGLQLLSAMAAAWGCEPPLTTKVPDLADTIDYIWASSHWQVLQALQLPYHWGRGQAQSDGAGGGRSQQRGGQQTGRDVGEQQGQQGIDCMAGEKPGGDPGLALGSANTVAGKQNRSNGMVDEAGPELLVERHGVEGLMPVEAFPLLPTECFPSDHLAMGAQLALRM